MTRTVSCSFAWEVARAEPQIYEAQGGQLNSPSSGYRSLVVWIVVLRWFLSHPRLIHRIRSPSVSFLGLLVEESVEGFGPFSLVEESVEGKILSPREGLAFQFASNLPLDQGSPPRRPAWSAGGRRRSQPPASGQRRRGPWALENINSDPATSSPWYGELLCFCSPPKKKTQKLIRT